jgi:RNA polymerase sigma-70 factor, ECF subfamily
LTAVADEFIARAERHRRELHVHCYRMLGSFEEAEDLVQETLLRAWRSRAELERDEWLRAWLYKIATNACLKLLERRPRKLLAAEYGPPAEPHDTPAEPLTEVPWLGPYPDVAVGYEQRESVELAFVAALQHLPAKQRAVLILRDVLGFSGAEVAATLETSPEAVYSALQRAHRTIDERLPDQTQQAALVALGDEGLKHLVERYMRAWESADVDAVVALLTEDATLTMPPRPTWFSGREAIRTFLAGFPLGRSGRVRLEPARANGQLAFAQYLDGAAHGLQVLALRGDRVAEIATFLEPERLALFGATPGTTRGP